MFTPAKDIPEAVRKMAVAVHEAGHAVVAIALKRKVTGAMLRPNGLSGETQFENTPAMLLDLQLEAHRHIAEEAILVLYAGQIAEAAYWDSQAHRYKPFIDTHREDEREIRQMMVGFNFDAESEADFRAHCTEKVKNYLDGDQAKAAIGEIAQKLSDTHYISRLELDEVMRKHELIEDGTNTGADAK